MKTLEVNDEEQKERHRYLNPKRRIDGILFDTEDPETRLIGQVKAGSAGWANLPKEKITDCEQLWRTKDGHYFLCDFGGPKHIDTKTAHDYMSADQGFTRFLTLNQKRELDLADERR